jgi:hypothetical protein
VTLFIQTDATGAGAGSLDPNQAAVDLAIATNGDTGLGLNAAVGNRQQVTYARTLAGPPPVRVDTLVNTNFSPDYGAGPQAVPVIVLPVLSNFVLNDGTSILVVGGTALAPQGTGLPGSAANNTNDCLVIYDTTQNNGAGYCTARAGTGGTLDLATPNPIILYHELSHAFRIVNNTLLALGPTCNPASPEESAAITEENDLRTQIANAMGTAVVLRDPNINCGAVCGGGGGGGGGGSCCIIASVASRSPMSGEVQMLRALRDQFLRRTEVGFAFFRQLFHDYYSFSPQVCTAMSREPSLPPLVLEGYVRPLISVLQLMRELALDGSRDTALGRRFVQAHADVAECEGRLTLLQQVERLWDGDELPAHGPAREVAELIRRHACTSEHVQWALIDPVRLYAQALAAHLCGHSAAAIGRGLRTGFDRWSERFPIDHVWASLPASELEAELRTLETVLLRSARARTGFRRRLLQRFGDITAVRRVLGAACVNTGAMP